MNLTRGIVMLILGAGLIYMGWTHYTGTHAKLALAIGALAILVGIWRIASRNRR